MNLQNKTGLTLSAIAKRVGGTVEGSGEVVITGVAPIEKAESGEISFVANPRYTSYIETTKASALVLNLETKCHRLPVLRHKNPYLIFAQIIDLFYPNQPLIDPGIDRSAIVAAGAQVDPTAGVGPFCHVSSKAAIGKGCQLVSSVYVGANVTIGQNCLIYPGVQILDDTKIGNRVIIHSSSVIGSDGFGFAQMATGLRKVRQVGWVEIADDVEIGANCSLDRGTLGPTRIGRGTKIDNLVQIAHNVQIGEHSIIVSQVGISGSTKIGNGVILAGQVGVIGHLDIGDGVRAGAQSGISKSIPAGQTVFGSPAREIMETKRIEAALTRLPELLKRVKRIEEKLKE